MLRQAGNATEPAAEPGRSVGRASFQVLLTEDPDEACKAGVDGTRRGTIKKGPRTVEIAGNDDFGWRLAAVGICCCLSVVGIGASLAVLAQYPADSEGHGGSLIGLSTVGGQPGAQHPLLVVFSAALVDQGGQPNAGTAATNGALAGLVAGLLRGDGPDWRRKNRSSLFLPEPPLLGPFVPDGGRTVRSWRPRLRVLPQVSGVDGALPGNATARPARGLAFVHGPVADILRVQYGLGPPQVRDLRSGDSFVGEPDAFLRLSALLHAEPKIARALPVLVSHPHRLPCLLLFARAVNLEVRVLDPALFDVAPWAKFGCSALGYPSEISPVAAVAAEVAQLEAYAQQPDALDPERFPRMASVVRAANATLQFHKCVAGVYKGGEASQASGACRRAIPPKL